jgi:hypothetical protein
LKYQTRGTSKRVKDPLPEFVDGKGWGVQGTGVAGFQELQESGIRSKNPPSEFCLLPFSICIIFNSVAVDIP